MDNKGQAMIENAIMGLLAITVFALLMVAIWPLTANFISLANTSANFGLWSNIANMVPVLIVLMIIIAIIRKFINPGSPQYPANY